MEILKEIEETAKRTCNPCLEKAKRSGKRIIGYFCSYVPEELIHAAGLIPYRMRAVESSGTSLGDSYFSSTNCTFVRHCLDKGLRGDFDFLDGIIFVNGCDQSRRLYDNWKYAGIRPEFLYMLPVPYVISDTSLKQYTEEVVKLKEKLGETFNTNITDEALHNSISLYNRKRDLLSRISESRKNNLQQHIKEKIKIRINHGVLIITYGYTSRQTTTCIQSIKRLGIFVS